MLLYKLNLQPKNKYDPLLITLHAKNDKEAIEKAKYIIELKKINDFEIYKIIDGITTVI